MECIRTVQDVKKRKTHPLTEDIAQGLRNLDSSSAGVAISLGLVDDLMCYVRAGPGSRSEAAAFIIQRLKFAYVVVALSQRARPHRIVYRLLCDTPLTMLSNIVRLALKCT